MTGAAHLRPEVGDSPLSSSRYATSRSLTVDITHALSHGLSHSVTHAIVHKYYCQYCFQYHEYCQYCFFYNDYTWMHRLWSTGATELTAAGEPIGNQFGGSESTS